MLRLGSLDLDLGLTKIQDPHPISYIGNWVWVLNVETWEFGLGPGLDKDSRPTANFLYRKLGVGPEC